MEFHDVKALEAVLKALHGLEAAEQERVLRWAAEKLELGSPIRQRQIGPPGGDPAAVAGASLDQFESLGDAWGAAQVSSDPERALFVAAFLTKKSGQTELTGQEINRHLKDLGHRIGSINKAVGALQGRRPQLMVQTKKSGNTRQARKNYKVTAAGFAAAEKLLRHAEGEES